MKSYRIYQVDSFTKERFTGNPAGVVVHADGLSEEQMQAIARELNNSETAFILSPTASDHDVWIRFFTPTSEVPSCGHATIAAHYVRAIEHQLPSCTVFQRIGIGTLPVEIVKDEQDYTVTMTQGKIEIADPYNISIRDLIVQALGLHDDDRDDRCPVGFVSTGHGKVMIGIKERRTLHALKPDFSQLSRISKEIGCNGFFVFTLDGESDDILAHGRMFAPAIGINEDPVTGNANGPLGAYLVFHGLLKELPENGEITFEAKQGEAMGRPGIVQVTVEIENNEPVKTKIGGPAVIAFQTMIML